MLSPTLKPARHASSVNELVPLLVAFFYRSVVCVSKHRPCNRALLLTKCLQFVVNVRRHSDDSCASFVNHGEAMPSEINVVESIYPSQRSTSAHSRTYAITIQRRMNPRFA